MKALVIAVQYAVVVLVADGENAENEAVEVAEAAIKAGEVKPLDRFTIDAKTARDVPAEWLEQSPFVGASVTDEAFAAVTKDGESVNVILQALGKP